MKKGFKKRLVCNKKTCTNGGEGSVEKRSNLVAIFNPGIV